MSQYNLLQYPLAFGAADKLGEDKVTKFEEVLGWVNGWVEGTVFADGTGNCHSK